MVKSFDFSLKSCYFAQNQKKTEININQLKPLLPIGDTLR